MLLSTTVFAQNDAPYRDAPNPEAYLIEHEIIQARPTIGVPFMSMTAGSLSFGRLVTQNTHHIAARQRIGVEARTTSGSAVLVGVGVWDTPGVFLSRGSENMFIHSGFATTTFTTTNTSASSMHGFLYTTGGFGPVVGTFIFFRQ